ncbi:MAG: ABC transporter ATP-binding protein [Candidatus Aenigmatarchaeota archaeon]
MKETIIELDDVHKYYKMGETKVHALRGSSLEVKKGEFLAIEGPSGSGKSTLMNLIGCLDVPSSGHVFLEGIDISKLHESDLAQIRGKKIGFVFQTFNLMPTLTALENVAMPMIFQGIPREERNKKAKKLLERVDLENRLNHRPSQLSGGQQQRVAIARSLSNDPDVILADEPTGNLDSKTGKNVLNFLDDLNGKEGKTIVMVTHDPRSAGFSKRTITIKDGVVNEN